MIKLSPDQLYKKIIDDQVKRITWYEGYIPNPKDSRHHFHRFKDEDPNAVLANSTQLLNTYPGLFTVMMERTTNGGSEPPIVLRVETAISNQGTMNGLPNGGGITQEQMYQKVLADVKQEMEIQNLKNQNEILKMKLQGFHTTAQKLGHVGAEIVMHVLKVKAPNLAKNMQGFADFEDVTGTEEKTGDSKKEEQKPIEIKDKKRLAQSLEKIINALGEDTFNKVADLLEKDPSKAELLKNFL